MKKTLLLAILCSTLLVLPYGVRAYTNEEECGFCKQEPDCCVEMRSTGDAFACSWPIRGYCTPDTCNHIDGNHQKCGWYWAFHDANANEYHLGTNSSKGYGCMIGDTEATMHPRCDPSPVPTVKPTAKPLPTVKPTSRPLPTALPPTTAPTAYLPPSTAPLQPIPSATPMAFPITQPTSTIPLPTVTVASPLQLTDFQIPYLPIPCSTTEGKTDIIQRLFNGLIEGDRQLEISINSFLQSLISTFTVRLNP